MTLEEAFSLMNNLDVREALRRYSPQYSNVVVDASGELLEVVRYKERPTLEMDRDNLKKYPNAFQFPSWPGRFNSVDKLAAWIREGVSLNRRY